MFVILFFPYFRRTEARLQWKSSEELLIIIKIFLMNWISLLFVSFYNYFCIFEYQLSIRHCPHHWVSSSFQFPQTMFSSVALEQSADCRGLFWEYTILKTQCSGDVFCSELTQKNPSPQLTVNLENSAVILWRGKHCLRQKEVSALFLNYCQTLKWWHTKTRRVTKQRRKNK